MDQPTNTQTQHQHEPISFGIDQILNSSDQETPSQPAPRGSDGGSTNYLGGPVSRTSAPYPSLPGAFPGIGAPFEDSGSYSVNLSLAPSGVIRVPAHRPIPGAVPPPISSAIPAMPAVPSLGSLNFPWMESSRRFVKDRFTGKRRGFRGNTNRRSAQSTRSFGSESRGAGFVGTRPPFHALQGKRKTTTTTPQKKPLPPTTTKQTK